MFFPPSGVLGFDVAFVAFGDEEALSGPPRDSRLSRRMQSYSSSSNTHKKKMALHRCFNITQPVLEPCRPAQRSLSSPPPLFFFTPFLLQPSASFPSLSVPALADEPPCLHILSALSGRSHSDPPCGNPARGRRTTGARCTPASTLAFRHFNGAPTSSLCRISKH